LPIMWYNETWQVRKKGRARKEQPNENPRNHFLRIAGPGGALGLLPRLLMSQTVDQGRGTPAAAPTACLPQTGDKTVDFEDKILPIMW